MNEEDLQSRLEAGEKLTGKDALAYRRVFDALEREPDFRLPMSFADAVMSRVLVKQDSKKEYWIIAGGVLFFVMATIIACITSNVGFSTDAFTMTTDGSAYQFVRNYTGLFIFGAAFIFGLQWVDKRFIKPYQKRAEDLSL